MMMLASLSIIYLFIYYSIRLQVSIHYVKQTLQFNNLVRAALVTGN